MNSMAEEEEEEETAKPQLPVGRVKRIMKLDKDINKLNSDALHLVTYSTELFLRFLAEKSSVVTMEKKRKTVTLDHLRSAVKRHQPTRDFLLESLPLPCQISKPAKMAPDKPPPIGSRRIDQFFTKGKAHID